MGMQGGQEGEGEGRGWGWGDKKNESSPSPRIVGSQDLAPYSNFFISIFGRWSSRSSVGPPVGRAHTHTHTKSDHLLLNHSRGYKIVSVLC